MTPTSDQAFKAPARELTITRIFDAPRDLVFKAWTDPKHVAYFQFAFPQGFWPVLNGGAVSALYCFVWLYFSAAGAGPWSLAAKWGR